MIRYPKQFFIGMLLILLGCVALYSALWSTLISVILIGALLFASGIAQIMHGFWQKNSHGFYLDTAMGLLALIPGALILFKPIEGAAALTLVIAVMLVAQGIGRIIASLNVKFKYWEWALASGIITGCLGLYIIYLWPAASLWLIGTFVGVDLIMNGWALVLLSTDLFKK